MTRREKSATISGVSVPHLLVAFAWLGGGLAAWGRRRARGSAVLMLWVGAMWLLGDAFQALVLLHWGALAHLLIAYPSGRLGSRLARAAVFVAYVASVLGAVLPGTGWTLGFAIALLVATIVRFATANGAVRRSRAVPLAVSVGVGAVLGAVAVLSGHLLPVYELTLGVAALALAADLRIAHWSRAAITGLVVDLGRRPGDSMIDEQLARAVGDPSLVVGYVVEEGRPPVDERGRPIALPEPGAGRAVTPVAYDGRTLAVLVHDSASLGDPRLLAGARLRAQRRSRQRSSAGRVALADGRDRGINATARRCRPGSAAPARRRGARPGGPAARGGWPGPPGRRSRRSPRAADRPAPGADALC
jgi:hypothetical protein